MPHDPTISRITTDCKRNYAQSTRFPDESVVLAGITPGRRCFCTQTVRRSTPRILLGDAARPLLAHELGEAVRAATGYRPTEAALDDALRRDRDVRVGWRDGQCVYWIATRTPTGAPA